LNAARLIFVVPAQAGIQLVTEHLDCGLRQNGDHAVRGGDTLG
jgi:hypothetical protein